MHRFEPTDVSPTSHVQLDENLKNTLDSENFMHLIRNWKNLFMRHPLLSMTAEVV
jgi:hypothetical protein